MAVHFGMGAGLGLFLSIFLIHLNVADVGAMIEHSFDPGATAAEFVGGLVLPFGIGATLTAFILMELDRARID